MNENPETMPFEATVLEIQRLQEEIHTRGRRIAELASTMYRRVRRAPADDSTVIYMTYANALSRYAGAIDQVSLRTVRAARVLERLPAKAPEEKKTKAPPVKQPEHTPSPMESLISLYVSEDEEPAPTSVS